ncbi:hypothetical protein A9K71_23545 [Mesorhizobium sp. WSM3873]|nr:hypothetical protein A9K71_23545 [Mesorhizobium sp. WSM3873]
MEVTDRAGESIKPGNDQHIVLTNKFDHPLKLWALRINRRYLFTENLLASLQLQVPKLRLVTCLLLNGAGPGVAHKHAISFPTSL